MEASLGPHLANLVKRMSRKIPDGNAVYRELALRTGECLCSDDFGRPLEVSYWFDSMKTRYCAAVSSVVDSEEAKRVASFVSTLYAEDVKTSELFDVFQNINAMRGIGIEEKILHKSALQLQQAMQTSGIGWVSPTELGHYFVHGPYLSAKLSNCWWENDVVFDHVMVQAVYLIRTPPTLATEYQFRGDSKLYRRRVHLENEFSVQGSTALLSKRLAQKNGCLLKEEDVQKMLIKLQKLAREAPLQHLPRASVLLGNKTVNQADVGLLYRDPEAALENVDLQEADDFTVKEFKAKMDEKYKLNSIRPGDQGYMYDIRKEFKPSAKSEWDDDDE